MNAYEFGVKLALEELGITKEAQQPASAGVSGINSILGSFGMNRGRNRSGTSQGGRQPRKIPQMGGIVGNAQRNIRSRQARQRRAAGF